jgi:hypothetical protein
MADERPEIGDVCDVGHRWMRSEECFCPAAVAMPRGQGWSCAHAGRDPCTRNPPERSCG